MKPRHQSGSAVAAATRVFGVMTALSLAVLAHAAPSSGAVDLRLRHGDEHEHEHDSAHMHGVDELASASSSISSAIPSSVASSSAVKSPSAPSSVPAKPPSSHDHGSHTAPLQELQDDQIHYWHHFPPTYLAADFRLDNDSAIFGEEFDESWNPDEASGHRGLLFTHAFVFYTAYFGLLPVALALRAADHPSHYLAYAAFLVVAVLGWLAGAAYNGATPDRYEGSVYPKFVNILLLTSISLGVVDSLGLIRRAVAFYRSGNRSWSEFTSQVLRNSDEKWLDTRTQDEMVGLQDEFVDEEEPHDPEPVFALGDDDEEEVSLERRHVTIDTNARPTSLHRQWTPPSRPSTASDHTLAESPTTQEASDNIAQKVRAYETSPDRGRAAWNGEAEPSKKIGPARFLEIVLTWVRRSQVVFAYVTLLAGIVTYTGMCRASFINSCAAHYIKGSIFFGYGLLTFARYLGAYADMGWAWNRRPDSKHGPSAEMIESVVIFTYGITNTWMERMGAAPGDPYTVKQVQHISIAIMFWFCGLTGIFLESRSVRKILATITGRRGQVDEPPSYAFSFNPLPALVIGVTGLAMAAHHQTYAFQVSIHSLWGILLAGGSACRFLTYFFLWIRPPVESTLPSRPPTEVLTALGWAAGGIVFMLSNEEIAFAAMRAGYDDMMAFLNLTVALTSFVFCWTLVVLVIKGMAVVRLHRTQDVESS